MANPDQFQAFALAAELGSFSAAARQMGKAQSAVSTAIANLEIDAGVGLFDRSARNPVLTKVGEALLPHARGILLGNQEFFSKASSMAEGAEAALCFAIEQSISVKPLMDLIAQFSVKFADLELEILRPGPHDTATLLREGRADLGLMTERENYPMGFQFRGVGHSKLIPVCAPAHPLADLAQVGFHDLRKHRQLIPSSRSRSQTGHLAERKGTSVWYVESLDIILEFVATGFGWAELPASTVSGLIAEDRLSALQYSFQQSDILEGVDVVWTEQKALGVAAHWLRDRLLGLPVGVWQGK
ncbi:MAG: LysR family transcriptional regulator [Pikeienuella sp.]